MKVAEVRINRRVNFAANDDEYHRFQLACLAQRENVSVVLRKLIREYVENYEKSTKGSRK